MKKKVAMLALLGGLAMAIPSKAQAHSYDMSDEGYPLRYVAYVVHPIGIAIQDFIVRPIHKWISVSPERSYWFGHQPRKDEKY